MTDYLDVTEPGADAPAPRPRSTVRFLVLVIGALLLVWGAIALGSGVSYATGQQVASGRFVVASCSADGPRRTCVGVLATRGGRASSAELDVPLLFGDDPSGTIDVRWRAARGIHRQAVEIYRPGDRHLGPLTDALVLLSAGLLLLRVGLVRRHVATPGGTLVVRAFVVVTLIAAAVFAGLHDWTAVTVFVLAASSQLLLRRRSDHGSPDRP